MPEKKTRLTQLLRSEQARRQWTDRACGEAIGVIQQTFSSWKRGVVPRPAHYGALAEFLHVSPEAIVDIVDEAGTEKPPTLAAYSAARVYGRISDRKTGKYKFDTSRKAVPEGRYAIVIDTKVMEPALLVGTKAWTDPSVWPQAGNDVIVHTRGGVGWLGRLEATTGETAKLSRYDGTAIDVDGVTAIHVIVLAERL